MRPALLVIAGLGLVAAGGAAWWQSGAMARPGSAPVPAPVASVSPDEAPGAAGAAVTPAPQEMIEIIGERVLAAPGERLAEQTGEAGPVPVPDDAAVAALRNSMQNGDPRTPPLARSEDLREMPSAEELADPELYQQYEQRQSQKVYASFVTAANQKIRDLEKKIARAEAEGLPPEQLEEGRQKLEGLINQRDEIVLAHPEVAAEVQSASGEAGGQE